MIVTFYSYKGGVGRSSALINVAYYLAQTGRNVCLIDFDLEAPGLHKMPCFEKVVKHNKNKGGLIDYITAYLSEKKIPDLEDYLINTQVDNENEDIKNEKPVSKLSLLSAGKIDKKYNEKLSEIDWKDLYKNHYGFYLFKNLTKELKEKYDFDYVLIDSRTGFNDPSAICTKELPEVIVVLFGLNNQNIEGIDGIYNSVDNNKIKIIPVISPLNESSINDLDKKINDLGRIFKNSTDVNSISYNSLLSNKETIIFEHKYKNMIALTQQYRILGDRIASYNDSDAVHIRNVISKNINDIEKTRKLMNLSLRVLSLNPLSVDYFNYAFLLYRQNNFIEAKNYIEKAISKNRKNPDYLYLEILILSALNEDVKEKAESFIRLYPDNINLLDMIAKVYINKKNYTEARNLLQKLITLDKNNSENYLMYSDVSYSEEEYEKAFEYIKLAIDKQSNNFNIYFTASRIAHKMNKIDLALEYIDLAIEHRKPIIDYNILAFKAEILHCLSKTNEAIEIYQECIKNRTNNSNYYRDLAYIYFDICNYSDSVKNMKKSIESDKHNVSRYLSVLASYFHLNNQEKVSKYIKHIDYLLIAARNRRTEDFYTYIELLVSIYPDNTKADFYYQMLKHLCIENADKDFVSTSFIISVKRDLAHVCMLLRKYNEAIELYTQKDVIKPYVKEYNYFNLAMAYLFTDDLKNAKINFRKTIDIFEKLSKNRSLTLIANYLLCKSIAYSYIDNNEQAIICLKECLEFIENNNGIKKIFSPKDYKLIDKPDFINLCNKVYDNLKSNRYSFEEII